MKCYGRWTLGRHWNAVRTCNAKKETDMVSSRSRHMHYMYFILFLINAQCTSMIETTSNKKNEKKEKSKQLPLYNSLAFINS
mmetsp:Transcript_49498/g.120191  ORF Transcript_49498/g.120191 Transcript_49498/m.120191 type:complete len:82 (+) Transcript_49498:2606-2851(+)